MSVVVSKIYDNKIVFAADSICVRGWSKATNATSKFTKMRKINNMIIGIVGSAEEGSLFFHFAETHSIKAPTEKDVMDYIIEFKKWKRDLSESSNIENDYLIAFRNKCFHVENLFVVEVPKYCAIGAGEDYAHGALYMGATPKEAVEAACELCAMVSEPIIEEVIKF